MKKEKIERWMSQAMDGELSPRQLRKLESALAVHPEWSAARQPWEALGHSLRDRDVVPQRTAEAAWQDVQRAIRLQEEEKAGLAAISWTWRWAPAAAALIVAAFIGWRWMAAPAPVGFIPIAAADRTVVEWVETDLPDAMSMVYEDEETGLTIIWLLVQENGEESRHAG